MNPNLQKLHALGQSLWLDNITREILGDGTFQKSWDSLLAGIRDKSAQLAGATSK